MNLPNIPANNRFIGRRYEVERLKEIASEPESAIIVVHGRRRIGKTELIEQTFRKRRLIKFEGLEEQNETVQQHEFLRKLGQYTENPLYSEITPKSWRHVFELLAQATAKGAWTIFLEELQWMASYDSRLLSGLKPVWDDLLRRNPQLLLILCGSSPSFMVEKVVLSRALYGRSMHEIALKPFGIRTIQEFLGNNSAHEAFNAALLVGGIPAYLKRLERESSVYLGFCKNTFVPNGYFSTEVDKIFLSVLAKNPNYRKTVEFLSKRKFATRSQILKHLRLSSGGTTTTFLEDLEQCGFVNRYTPINKSEDSKLSRYEISDAYLNSYYRFVKPQRRSIQEGKYKRKPTAALPLHRLSQAYGYAFERWCRANSLVIARALGFEDVDYQVGPFFNRSTQAGDPGYQLDLIFHRADKTYTICEVKYVDKKLSANVGETFNRKLEAFDIPQRYRVQKVLITANEYHEQLQDFPYFDRVLTLENILKATAD